MKSDIVFSNEASRILSWTTMASRQARESCPVIAYNFKFLFSAALISLQPSAVASHNPTGRPDVDPEVTSLLVPDEGLEGRSFISHFSLAYLVPMC